MANLPRCRRDQNFKLPSKIKILKAILDQYPDDGQILKELVQNADDAGARTVRFLLDESQYSQSPDGLFSPGMANYQGPSLLAYNDAKFESKDWEGIRSIHQSVKEDNPLKVGKFGLGFKSVFHLTDLVSYISCESIGFLDPHQRHFFDINKSPASSYEWDMTEFKDEMPKYSAQWQPYLHDIFQLSQETLDAGWYNNTLFRFPLRHNGYSSEISEDPYDVESVLNLFKSIQQEGHLYIMFLKHVEKIELFHKKSLNDESKLIFSVEISPDTIQLVQQQRQDFYTNLKIEHFSSYWMKIRGFLHEDNSDRESIMSYLVCQYISPDAFNEHCSPEKHDKSLPLVGLALPADRNLDMQFCNGGHIFCFLPFPLTHESQTGIALHVNGYFEVNQNRRNIKLPSLDKTKKDYKKYKDPSLWWNLFLIEEVLPKCLLQLLKKSGEAATDNQLDSWKMQRIFPVQTSLRPFWDNVRRQFYASLLNEKVFYTASDGGKLISMAEAIFLPAESEDESAWEKLITKIFHAREELMVVRVTKEILEELKSVSNVKIANHGLISKTLSQVQQTIQLSDEERTMILHEVLSCDNAVDLLNGLQLLPVQSGEWIRWCSESNCQSIYISMNEHPQELLPNSDAIFFRKKCCADDVSNTRLKLIVNQGSSQVTWFSPKAFQCELQKIQHLKQHCLVGERKYDMKWYSAVWDYLLKYFAYNLQGFEELNIVPCNNESSCLKLSTKTVLFETENKELALQLQKVGFEVVANISAFSKVHPKLSEYVYYESNLPSALKHLSGKIDLASTFKGLNDDSKDWWRTFLSDLNNLHCYKDILCNLPIFRTYPNSNGIHFTSCSRINEFVHKIPFSVVVEILIPHSNTLKDYSFLESMGCKQKSTAKFLIESVLPIINGINESVRVETLTYCLENIFELRKEEPNIISIIKGIKFIATEDGKFRCPNEVLDRQDYRTVCLLKSLPLFPTGRFAEVQFQSTLKLLGLRGYEDISASELDMVIKNIHNMAECNEPEYKTVSAYLLSYLGSHKDVARRVDFNTTANWVPVAKRPQRYPTSYPWKGDRSSVTVVSSKELISVDKAKICGSSRFLVEFYECLKSHYREPPLEDVTKHFQNVITEHSTEWNVSEHEYGLMLKDVTSWLKRTENVDNWIQNMTENNIKKWLLIGDEFVAPQNVVKDERQSIGSRLKPFLYSLPTHYNFMSAFLIQCGMKNSLQQKDLIGILKMIKDDLNEAPANSLIVEQVRTVAKMVYEMRNSAEQTFNTEEVYLLNKKMVMQLATDLVHDNTPWFESNEEFDFCDPGIPYCQSQYLGVKTMKDKVIDRHSLGISFGQSEDLSTRINNILRGYPEMTLIKELLQNADDSMATQVHIIADARRHSSKQTFNPDGWKNIQGPSLMFYNERGFSDKDLQGIKNLGIGSKGDDPCKTGQYGIGFNSVYNITDTPTILTTVSENGKKLIAFDPQCESVYGASKAQPGRLFDVEEFQNRFPDVFSPFEIPGLQLGKGTLIRLPLRSQSQAHCSKIAKHSYSHEDIVRMINNFLKQEAQECLLFMRYVKEISFSIIDQKGRINSKFSAMAQLSEEDAANHANFVTNNEAAMNEKAAIANMQTRQVSYDMAIAIKIGENDNEKKNWTIIQQFGFSDLSQEHYNTLEQQNAKIKNIPCGGVAYCQQESKQAKLFCTLPLKVKTTLKFHVNGHFALNADNRDGLISQETSHWLFQWNQLMLKNIIAPCLLALVKTQQVSVIDCDKHQQYLKRYLALFPFQNVADPSIGALEEGVIQLIHQKCHNILPCLMPDGNRKSIEWCSIKDAVFDEYNNDDVQECLKRWGVKVLPWMKELTVIFKRCSKHQQCLSLKPDLIAKHIRQASAAMPWPAQLEDTPFQTVEELVNVWKFISSLKKEDGFGNKVLYGDVLGLPLLLSESKQVMKLEHDKLYATSWYKLLPSCGNKFLKAELLSNLGREQLFPAFTVDILATMLPNELAISIWKVNDQLLYEVQKMHPSVSRSSAHDSLQILNSSASMTFKYLEQFWKFLENEYSRKEVTKEKILLAVGQWSLFPCTYASKSMLIPINKSSIVFDPNQDRDMTTGGLSTVIKSLPFYKPVDVFSKNSLYIGMMSNLDKPDSVAIALKAAIQNGTQDSLRLIQENADLLLVYFERAATQTFDNGLLESLKSLPMFLNTDGKRVSIHQKQGIMIQESIPLLDPKQFPGYVFLKKQSYLEKFGVLMLKETDIYIKFILPGFSLLPERDQMTHLKFLHELCQSKFLVDRTDFIGHLEKTPLVSGERASAFCSPKEDFFGTFFPVEVLPERYTTFTDLLLELGLRREATMEEILIAAQGTAEKDISSVSEEEFRNNLKLVFKQLIDRHQNEKFPLTFYDKFRKIPCMPKLQNDLSVLLQGKHSLELQCCNGSFESKDSDLVWTHGIIDTIFIDDTMKNDAGERKDLKSLLGICTQVSSSNVVHHLKEVSKLILKSLRDTGGESHDIIKLYTRQLEAIFRFIQQQNDTFHIAMLACLPVRFNEKYTLVAFQSIVMLGLEDDSLFPHFVPLCWLPSSFQKFGDVLHKLGSVKKATLDSFVMFLNKFEENQEIKEEWQKTRIGNAYKQILEQLERRQRFELKTPEFLLLPNQHNVMMKTSKLYFVDKKELKERAQSTDLNIIVDCPSELPISQQVLAFFDLPQNLQPEMLSSSFVEKVLPFESVDLSELAMYMTRKLSSKSFEAILSDSLKEDVTLAKEQGCDIESIIGAVTNCQIACADGLKTCIVHNEVKLDNSEKDVLFHVEWCEEIIKIILQKSCGLEFESEINVALAYKLFSKFRMSKETEQAISGLFAKSIERINFCHTEKATKLHQRLEKFKRGDIVPTAMEYSFEMSLEALEKGDFVAIEKQDDIDEGSDVHPTYVFGEVMREVKHSSSRIENEYLIDTGTELRVMKSVYMYKFNSETIESSTSELQSCAGEIEMDTEQMLREAYLTGDERIVEQALRRSVHRMSCTNNNDQRNRISAICKALSCEFSTMTVSRLEAVVLRSQRQWTFISRIARSQPSGTRIQHNPRPDIAKEMLNIAKQDLKAAVNDTGEIAGTTKSLRWACYKIHQAAEKALKAERFLEYYDDCRSHSLTAICRSGDWELAMQLVSELGFYDPNILRYKSYLPSLESVDLGKAIAIVREIISKVEDAVAKEPF